MNHRKTWLAVVSLILLASCTSGGDSSDGWSRTYFAPYEQVFEAVIAVLDDEGYVVDIKEDKGRVSAEPSQSSSGNLAAMVVQVTRKNDRIHVDVQTRSGATFSTLTARPKEEPILEFLHELDLRLKSGPE
jgi:hypothetical protein